MASRLTQFELEDLSAYLDGELEQARAAEVAELISKDAAWAAAYWQLRAVESAMDAAACPHVAPEMADRVIAAVYSRRRRGVALKFVGYAASAAAAAAVVIAVMLWHNKPLTVGPPSPVVAAQVDDEMVVENLEFFKDFQVVDNFQTLEAMDELEKDSHSGEEAPPQGT